MNTSIDELNLNYDVRLVMNADKKIITIHILHTAYALIVCVRVFLFFSHPKKIWLFAIDFWFIKLLIRLYEHKTLYKAYIIDNQICYSNNKTIFW